MSRTFTDEEPEPRAEERRKAQRQRFTLAMRPFLLAAIPVGLTIYYLSWVAPAVVPVPPGVKVPLPSATRFFEEVSVWCGEHSRAVLVIGIGLLTPGLLYREVVKAERYYLRVAIIVSVILGFTYLSISTPLDRFMRAVEENVPQDNRVPDRRDAGADR